ncbi:MAG: flagellar basal body L-ring protein FlgH [Fimbriimonadaceae bacterium]|nr:flagellar basal body L-ring protein FlgH [Fimbriimonadaceae bacterium]
MKRLSNLCAVLALTLAVLPAVGQSSGDNPGSLWTAGAKNPWKDRTAAAVGDVVTILISEVSNFSFAASTVTSKEEDNIIAKAMGPWLESLLKGWTTGGKSTNNGQGSTTQSGRLTTRLSATVAEVFPNGTMRIEGKRTITVNKESQEFRLSGLIRRDDIGTDNTVKSELIANAQIYAFGKGPVSDRQRKGILTRILDWLF